MGRYWFRAVEQQMLHEALASKSSGLRGAVDGPAIGFVRDEEGLPEIESRQISRQYGD